MAHQFPFGTAGATLVMGVAVLAAGVIALGFVIPHQLFDSSVGLIAFFAAGILMLVCAVLANLYDIRGSLPQM